MPRIGLSITKRTAFRNSTQEFSNVYYFEMLSIPSVSAANTLIDNMVTLEKTFHSTAVTFVIARLWEQTDSQATTQMITTRTLSGTGARSVTSGMDKERAYLFRIRAGVDSRGNPVYLRKYFHACGEFAGTGATPTTTVLDNTTGWTQAQRDTLVAALGSIGDANGSAGTPRICSKVGRLPDAGASWVAHPFLEHHQLGDQWRGQ